MFTNYQKLTYTDFLKKIKMKKYWHSQFLFIRDLNVKIGHFHKINRYDTIIKKNSAYNLLIGNKCSKKPN